MRYALFGGIYSNSLALSAAIDDARRKGAQSMYCLGDLGAFGPHPDRVFPLLRDHQIRCVQGNYDHSIGFGLDDCQCGYTDPRDNYFAQISYDYTLRKTSAENRAWMTDFPKEIRFEIDGLKVLLCHGSPRKTNEFLWESTTSRAFLDKLSQDFVADLILGTHTGLHWCCPLTSGGCFVNVGVLGRPENDGTTRVWYTLLSTGDDAAGATNHAVASTHGDAQRFFGRVNTVSTSEKHAGRYAVEFVSLDYDHERLAAEMRAEKLPEEFVQTTLTGWWTTCLEVLPARERRRGRF